jgi:hypothetical protein
MDDVTTIFLLLVLVSLTFISGVVIGSSDKPNLTLINGRECFVIQ